MLAFASRLPDLRTAVVSDLATDGLHRERVLAAIVRLLDVGYFGIGGEEHVAVRGGVMTFDYPSKGAVERRISVRDTDSWNVVAALRRRRAGGPNLFASREGRRWLDVHTDHVNGYIKAAAGDPFSAKDFRTWSATVLVAVALAEVGTGRSSPTARRRAVEEAVLALVGDAPELGRAA